MAIAVPTSDIIETCALVGLALFAEAIERWRGFQSPRLNERKWNSVGFLAVLVFVGLSRQVVRLMVQPVHGFDFERLPTSIKMAVALVLVDFCLYWIHRAMHSVPFLWRTHIWHHSAEQLNWLSGFRTSLPHAFLFAVPQITIPYGLLRFTPVETGIGFAVGIFIQIFGHLNIDFDYPLVNRWLATPNTHRLHHAKDVSLQHHNFGIAFMFWDHLFGTFQDPYAVPKLVSLGVDEHPSLARMLGGV